MARTPERADRRCSDRPVVLVRNRTFPNSEEREAAQLDPTRDRRGHLGSRRLAGTREVVHHHDALIEQPKVIARQGEIRGSTARQPAHLLAGGNVQRGCDSVLETDVLADRLADDTRAVNVSASTDDAANKIEPLRPDGRRVNELARAPLGESRMARRVGVPPLKVQR